MERQLKATAADPATVPCDGPAAARGRRLIAGARSAVSAVAVMLVAGASPASAAPVFFVTDTTDAPDSNLLDGRCESTHMGSCTLVGSTTFCAVMLDRLR